VKGGEAASVYSSAKNAVRTRPPLCGKAGVSDIHKVSDPGIDGVRVSALNCRRTMSYAVGLTGVYLADFQETSE
jgi:hypothetical protein